MMDVHVPNFIMKLSHDSIAESHNNGNAGQCELNSFGFLGGSTVDGLLAYLAMKNKLL